jgi:hypothetical protein
VVATTTAGPKIPSEPTAQHADVVGQETLPSAGVPAASDSFLAIAVPELFGLGGFLANTRATSAFVLLECSRSVAGGCMT